MDVRMFVLLSINLLLVCPIECNLDKFEVSNSWKIFDYYIDGVLYTNDSDYEIKAGTFSFDQVLEEHEKFLILKNLVPCSIVATFFDAFVSIPRTRPGIPFTLNRMNPFDILNFRKGNTALKPFPSTKLSKDITSVYDMERDGCSRIWMVDTGLIDIPGFRKQVQEPRVLVINTNHNVIVVKAKIGRELLRDGVTSGLRTIALDSILPCSETFMYINDDHSNAVIVFSVKDLSFRRIERPNTRDEAWTFPVPKSIVNYMKHAVRPRQLPSETFVEYSKSLETTIADQEKLRSDANLSIGYPRGVQYERNTGQEILLFTNEDRTQLYCWNIDTPMIDENIELLTSITENSGFYIADLDTNQNAFLVMANRIRDPNNNIYDEQQTNFVYYKGYLSQLLNNTKCTARTECTSFQEKWNAEYRDYSIQHSKYTNKFVTDEFKKEWSRKNGAIWDQL